jgi:RNA polymerase sigma factor (sigma-70 family)
LSDFSVYGCLINEMQDQSDAQLLRAYAEAGQETAFREIVTRHTDLVYSAALRQVNSPALARDLAQGVFTDLARKARPLSEKLAGGSSLVGWLYRSTRFAALKHIRDDRRRITHERQAMEQLIINSETSADWEQLRPVLDETMADLNDDAREAVLLRYFKNCDFQTVGRALGVSDAAAQKRVSRALDKLRELLLRRGVTTAGGALSVAIAANAVQAAPVGLAATFSTTAIAATTITAASVTATKTLAMTTLQKTLLGAAIAAVVGTGIYEAREASNARAKADTLRRQQGNLYEQIQQVTRERDEATNQIAALREDFGRLTRNSDELLKLRGQVGVLQRELASKERQGTQQSAPPKSMNGKSPAPGTVITRDQIAFAGYATPEATWESWLWAEYFGNYEQVLDCMTPEHRAWVSRDPKDRDMHGNFQSTVGSNFNWMQIVAKKALADDVVELKVRHLVGDRDESSIRQLRKVGGEWKFTGGSYPYQAAWDSNGQIQKFDQ